jgi:hypothetical protein
MNFEYYEQDPCSLFPYTPGVYSIRLHEGSPLFPHFHLIQANIAGSRRGMGNSPQIFAVMRTLIATCSSGAF